MAYNYYHFFMIRFVIFCCLILTSSSNILLGQENSSQEYKLVKQSEFYLNIVDNFFLGRPTNIEILDKKTLAWGEKTRLLFLGENGNEVDVFNPQGRGPGEFMESFYFQTYGSGNFAIYSAGQLKISLFDFTKNHLKDFSTHMVRPKKFVVLENGENTFFSTFNDMQFQQQGAAVSLYNSNGEITKEFGEIPPYALLQDPRNGGGITTDLQGNIYYSYLGGHKVWKIDTKNEKLSVFDQKPSYFDQVNAETIFSLGRDIQKIIAHSFKVSRVSGLFFVEPNLIIQLIDDGNPWEGEEVRHYLEVWNTKGEKVASKIEVSHWVAGTNGGLIYVYSDSISELVKKSDNKKRIKLFDIYKLSRESNE